MNRSAQNRATSAMLENSQAQMAAQREFAQHGIRWRVDDAKAAGIHPLYAMGASIPAYNPSPINIQANNSMGNALASAGQDISRAVQAKTTQQERQEMNAAQKQLLNAQTDYYQSLAAKNRQQTPPPLPSGVGLVDPLNPPEAPGQDPTAGVKIVPNEVTSAASSKNPSTTAGAHSGSQLVRSGKDTYTKIPNPDVYGEELTAPGMAGWFFEQQIRPKPPSFEVLRRNHPAAIGWIYNRTTRSFRPAYSRKNIPVYQKFFPLPGIPHPRPRVPHRGGSRNKHGNNRWGGIER